MEFAITDRSNMFITPIKTMLNKILRIIAVFIDEIK
jgi:hypothetical protein